MLETGFVLSVGGLRRQFWDQEVLSFFVGPGRARALDGARAFKLGCLRKEVSSLSWLRNVISQKKGHQKRPKNTAVLLKEVSALLGNPQMLWKRGWGYRM